MAAEQLEKSKPPAPTNMKAILLAVFVAFGELCTVSITFKSESNYRETQVVFFSDMTLVSFLYVFLSDFAKRSY